MDLSHVLQAVREEMVMGGRGRRPAEGERAEHPRAPVEPTRINALGRAPCVLRGEWWINEDGTAMFADGDVGDVNHEGMVLESLVREVLEHVGADVGDEVGGELLPQYATEIAEAFEIEEDDLGWPEVEAAVTDLWPDAEKRRDAFAALKGSLDAREYGLKHQGWKRLKGTAVETWTLTPSDLSAIARGIGDAAGDEADLDGCVFDVEVRSLGKFYTGVPWAVIERGQPAALRDYEFRGW